MPDAEEKQEKGGSLMFAGLAVWVACPSTPPETRCSDFTLRLG